MALKKHGSKPLGIAHKQAGGNYQTLINDALIAHIDGQDEDLEKCSEK